MKNGIDLISQEREEQLNKHSRYVIDDVVNNPRCELAIAARKLISLSRDKVKAEPPVGWDTPIWKKMCNKPYKERLIIAGALLAAELDRLLYIELQNK